jgi:hypothetical protein
MFVGVDASGGRFGQEGLKQAQIALASSWQGRCFRWILTVSFQLPVVSSKGGLLEFSRYRLELGN